MSTLYGNNISQTYQGLIKLADSTTGVTSTTQSFQDGLGNNLPIQVSNTTVNISGSFLVNGQPVSFTNTGSFATTGSNTFIGNQTIVGNVTFPSSSFISSDNVSGALYLSSLNQGTLYLNGDGGEGDVVIGYSAWQNNLKVKGGNTEITGSLGVTNIKGTGSLFLQPNQSDARYLEVYNTSPTDTHITASGGQIFLGDDVTYVKVDNYGSVKRIDVVADNGVNISGSVQVTGSLDVTGTITATSASITYLQTVYETASIIYSSGSNQLGDELTDTQTLSGSVQVQGELLVNGVAVVTGSVNRDGLITTGSYGTTQNISGSLLLNNPTGTTLIVSGGYYDTGSGQLFPAAIIQGMVQLTDVGDINANIQLGTSDNPSAGANINLISNINTVYGGFSGNLNTDVNTNTVVGMALSTYNTDDGSLGAFYYGAGTSNNTPYGPGSNDNSIFYTKPTDNYLRITRNTLLTGSLMVSGSQSITGSLTDFGGNLYIVQSGQTIPFRITGSAEGGNIIFGLATQQIPSTVNTGSWVITGSNNIIMRGLVPVADAVLGETGYKNFISGSYNIIYGNGVIVARTGSFGEPSTNNNIVNSNVGLYFLSSSLAKPVYNNNITNAQVQIWHDSGSVSATNNIINSTLASYANEKTLSQNTTIGSNAIIGTQVILNHNSSSITYSGNIGGINVNNNYTSSVSTAVNNVTVTNNLFNGSLNLITISGSNTANRRTFSSNTVLGRNNQINSISSGSNGGHMLATTILGDNLIVSASNTSISTGGGSVFVGRYNATGSNQEGSNEAVFVVGTGTGAGSRRNAIHIDSNNNTRITGSVSISGSLTVNGVTVSSDRNGLITTGSAGTSQTITGSILTTQNIISSGSITSTGNLQGQNIRGIGISNFQDNVNITGTTTVTGSLILNGVTVGDGNRNGLITTGSYSVFNPQELSGSLRITSGSLKLDNGKNAAHLQDYYSRNVIYKNEDLGKILVGGNCNMDQINTEFGVTSDSVGLTVIGGNTLAFRSGSYNTWIGSTGQLKSGSYNTYIGTNVPFTGGTGNFILGSFNSTLFSGTDYSNIFSIGTQGKPSLLYKNNNDPLTVANDFNVSGSVNITGQYLVNGVAFSGGTSGTSGTSGASGSSGSSGTSGSNGTDGSSGTSGGSGSSGTSGSSGSDGSSGTSGVAGSSGTSGSNGTDGSSGTSGLAGSSGSSGTSGATGASGSSGTSGTSGTSPSIVGAGLITTGSISTTQTITGSLLLSGSLTTTGSVNMSGSNVLRGTNTITGSNSLEGITRITGSLSVANTGVVSISSSFSASGSNTLRGANTITGSNTLQGLTTITGSNILQGLTTITGSLQFDSGSNITGSVQISGSVKGIVNSLSISSTTASLNLNNGNFFTLSLPTAVNTFVSASNITPGQTINLVVSNQGTGTVTFSNNIKQPSGSFFVATTGATAVDIVSLISVDNNNLYMNNVKNLI